MWAPQAQLRAITNGRARWVLNATKVDVKAITEPNRPIDQSIRYLATMRSLVSSSGSTKRCPFGITAPARFAL